jgi:hypothetical protein
MKTVGDCGDFEVRQKAMSFVCVISETAIIDEGPRMQGD